MRNADLMNQGVEPLTPEMRTYIEEAQDDHHTEMMSLIEMAIDSDSELEGELAERFLQPHELWRFYEEDAKDLLDLEYIEMIADELISEQGDFFFRNGYECERSIRELCIDAFKFNISKESKHV